jgi:hypothetical protein
MGDERPTRLSRACPAGERRLGAGADSLALVLGHGGEDVNGQASSGEEGELLRTAERTITSGRREGLTSVARS